MIILNILLRITGFTQEELANYVDISRASINGWLNDDSNMSISSKSKIANKFGFPISYFDYDLEQNIEIYKIIYSTIYNFWKINKPNNLEIKTKKIDEILNSIEAEFITKTNYTDSEIIDGLLNGYNPFTGEVFEENHILHDYRVIKTLEKLRRNNKFEVLNITKEDLNIEERKLFEKLRNWRMQKTYDEGFYSAYMVFSDKDLINIIKADIKTEKDLLNIKGIGVKKYEKYASELLEIIKC